MSNRQINALFAQVAPAGVPVASLSERDRCPAGADLPTVPLDGREWTAGEVAALLFEAYTDQAPASVADTGVLRDTIAGVLSRVDAVWLAQSLRDFPELDAGLFPEVGRCRTLGYLLSLSYWYEGARSRPMTVGEAAVALYLSDAYRHHQVDALTIRRAPLLVSRAVRQGAAAVPVETLVRLGAAIVREFTQPTPYAPPYAPYAQVDPRTHPYSPDRTTCVTPGVTPPSHPRVTPPSVAGDWLYRQALPDWHRRRFCFDLMRADTRQPTPLIVRLDNDGGYAVGATPPAGPDGTWARTLKAGW